VEDPAYQARLKARALEGSLSPALEAMLWHYLYGRPREQARPEDQAFVEDLLSVVLKHVTSDTARSEVRDVISRHSRGAGLRVVQ
jgi:hypothetical protein